MPQDNRNRLVFKRTQGDNERIADFVAELRRLVKTCNFSNYLDTPFRDQFVCGLRDKQCQQELLGIPELTADIALQKAAAAEMVSKETEGIREATSGANSSSDVHKTGRQQNVISVVKWGTTLQHASIRVQKCCL